MNRRDDVEDKPAAKAAIGSAGRNVVAVIGIDRYHHWPRLSNAVRDATGAAALFRRLGFEEIAPLLGDRATGTAIESLVTDDLMALGPDDSLVLFYAGHGGTRKHRLGNEVIKAGYLIPVEAAVSPDRVSTWVDLEGWLRAVSLLPARHILVVLDACHSGIALDPIIKWRDIGSWQDAPLPALQARRSRRIITSALDDQVAFDSGPVHGHSLFTGCLLEGLTGGIRGDRGAVTTGSELGLYVQRRVRTYPGARQTPDFGTFAFDDRGEMAIPLAIDRAPERPEESATAASPPAWLDLIDLDDPPEIAPETESLSGSAASRTGGETGRPITAEPGPAPPAAPADEAEPAPPAEARPHDLAFDDADALASALADARARTAAAMEQAWAVRKASRRELDDRTGGEVQAAPSELAAVASPETSGASTADSASPAGSAAVAEHLVSDKTDQMPQRGQVGPRGKPRQAPSTWQPAVSPVPTAREDPASMVRDVSVDSGEASASGVAGESAGTTWAPGPSLHTLAPSPSNAPLRAPRPEPARASMEPVPTPRPRRPRRSTPSWAPSLSLHTRVPSPSNAPSRAPKPEPARASTEPVPTPRPRRPRHSTPIVPPLPPPTEIVESAAPPASGVRRKIVLGAVVVGAMLAIALIAYVGHALSQKAPPAEAQLRVAASHPPDAATGIMVAGPLDAQPPSAGPPAGDCLAGMVRVSAGTFRMGNPDGVGDADEHPQHEVTLSAYCIDRTEVTVKAYAACVAAKGCSAAPLTVSWSEYSADDAKRYSRFCNREDRPDHPINCVDWNQAAAYCTWTGKRLPTEAEWEYAARGTDGRAYPWDNEMPSATRLNACGSECVAMARREKMYDASDRWQTTAPVGSFPDGVSPFGALDMAGNVWEWTADWYGTYPGAAATNPRGAEKGTARVIRGGGWSDVDAALVRAAIRSGGAPSYRNYNVGFRCARGD